MKANADRWLQLTSRFLKLVGGTATRLWKRFGRPSRSESQADIERRTGTLLGF